MRAFAFAAVYAKNSLARALLLVACRPCYSCVHHRFFPGVYTDMNQGTVLWLRRSGACLRRSGAWQHESGAWLRGSGCAREWWCAGIAMWGNGGAQELGAWEVGVHRSGGAWE